MKTFEEAVNEFVKNNLGLGLGLLCLTESEYHTLMSSAFTSGHHAGMTEAAALVEDFGLNFQKKAILSTRDAKGKEMQSEPLPKHHRISSQPDTTGKLEETNETCL